MVMPGRKFSAGNLYRYGFNGKENDNEVKGEGNQQDYGFRIYDTRLGKFLSVDPITKQYPELTPYQFASNTPIQAIDLDGLEAKITVNEIKDGKEVSSKQLDEKQIKALIPTLPKELKLTPGVGSLTIDKNKYSGFASLDDHTSFSYDPNPSVSGDEQSVYKYKYMISQAGSWFNGNIYPLLQSGGYGNEASYSGSVGPSAARSGTKINPLNGEIKVTNTSEISQSQVGTFNLNNTLSISGSINSALGSNLTSSAPTLTSTTGFENYTYFFLSNKVTLPQVGSTTEQTTSIKILALKMELTSYPATGGFKFKLGYTTAPGFEFKKAPFKAKTNLTSNSGAIKY